MTIGETPNKKNIESLNLAKNVNFLSPWRGKGFNTSTNWNWNTIFSCQWLEKKYWGFLLYADWLEIRFYIIIGFLMLNTQRFNILTKISIFRNVMLILGENFWIQIFFTILLNPVFDEDISCYNSNTHTAQIENSIHWQF